RLARYDELHGTIAIEDDPAKSIDVLEDEIGALVGGEASRESDRQVLGVERLVRRGDLHRRGSLAKELLLHALPNEAHEAIAEPILRAPELGVGDPRDALPDAAIERIVEPLRTHVALEE